MAFFFGGVTVQHFWCIGRGILMDFGRYSSTTGEFSEGCIPFTLQETNISPQKWDFEDDFPFPKMGYVNSLEGIQVLQAPSSETMME